MSETASAAIEERAAVFTDRMVDALNGGALCLMSSIGHRTGLFSVMGRLGAASSGELARAADLHERYVREWLGAMAVAGVVDYDSDTGRYELPPEHWDLLTFEQSPDNLAALAQYIGLLGSVEDDVVECFRKGGGVPYERYERFHEVMAEDSGQTVLPALGDHILPLVPGLTDRLRAGIDVLDAGCGRGKAVNLMASWFPNSRFVGYDLSGEAIAFARAEAAAQGHDNVEFHVRDLSDFDRSAEPGRFDLVTTFDAVHDQANPRGLLAGIVRSLKAGGVYLAQDINGSSSVEKNLNHPIGTVLYTLSCMHCMTVSLAQDGEGLGAMWGREQAEVLMREAGFSSVEIHELAHDFQNCYYVCRV